MKKLNLPRNLIALLTMMIFGNASERIIFPLFALVFFDLHSHLLASDTSHITRSYWYGICMAIPSIATFIAAPVLSCLSDFYGRKKLLMISLSGTMVAGLITSAAILSSSIYLFIFGVFVQGLFCRTNPLAQAVVGDIETGKNKFSTMGYLQSMIAFGAFLGPIIGGYCAQLYFAQINFTAPFLLSAILSAIGILICCFFFKETLVTPHKTLSLRLMFGSVFLFKETLGLAALLACGQFTWSLYYQYVPAALKLTNQFSAGTIGLFVGMMAFWVTLGSSLGIRLLRDRFNLFSCLKIGLLLQCLGGILIVIAFYIHVSWLIWLSSVPAATGDVIAFGVLSTMYSNRYPHQQGQAMGACYLNAALIWTVTGLLGGGLIALHSILPLIIAPFGVVLALSYLNKWLKPTGKTNAVY
ncbi:MAG: MFS transporter [Pseudomonadota bacterium]